MQNLYLQTEIFVNIIEPNILYNMGDQDINEFKVQTNKTNNFERQ